MCPRIYFLFLIVGIGCISASPIPNFAYARAGGDPVGGADSLGKDMFDDEFGNAQANAGRKNFAHAQANAGPKRFPFDNFFNNDYAYSNNYDFQNQNDNNPVSRFSDVSNILQFPQKFVQNAMHGFENNFNNKPFLAVDPVPPNAMHGNKPFLAVDPVPPRFSHFIQRSAPHRPGFPVQHPDAMHGFERNFRNNPFLAVDPVPPRFSHFRQRSAPHRPGALSSGHARYLACGA